VTTAPRRGRPPATSSRELRQIALRLFVECGFEATTIDQITAEAGVSERTFFRYFATKASVLWTEFDAEVEAIRAALAAVPDDVPMMEAIRRTVVSANHYQASDVPELRMRMNLIAARRLGHPAESLYPLAIGRTVLAACRAAYDRWSARADQDLPGYLDAALTALAAGFAPDSLQVDREVSARR
jgi:TetR/AcrR family transcriptional regulator, regulator of mycofactocin system